MLLRQFIKALRPFLVAFQLGDVAQIVQRERIVRVEQVGLVKQLLGFAVVVFFDLLYAIAVELLNRGGLGALGNGDTQVFAKAGQRKEKNHQRKKRESRESLHDRGNLCRHTAALQRQLTNWKVIAGDRLRP